MIRRILKLNYYLYLIIPIFFLLSPYQLFTQNLANKNDYFFHKLDEKKFVHDAYQDKQGFIWQATQHGLVRWDGVNEVWFNNNPNDPYSIAGDMITAIEPDGKGNLWLGIFGEGIDIFNHKTHKSIHLRETMEKANVGLKVKALEWDSTDKLWIGYQGGVAYYDVANRKFNNFSRQIERFTREGKLLGVFDIGKDKKENIWLSNSFGISRYDRVGDSLKFYFPPINAQDLTQISILSEDSIWVGSSSQALSNKLERINRANQRFVPNDFLKILGKKSIEDLQLGDQTKTQMTILFSDIRDYTPLSESMTPEENFKFINAYLGRVGPIIKAHGGFISSYLGDGLMALFVNEPKNALQATIAMQKELENYNQERRAVGKRALRTGMGLNTGDLMLGVIGDEHRYESTVISDAVNTASRMEGLTKVFGAAIILSEKTLEALAGKFPYPLSCRCKVSHEVRGTHPVTGTSPTATSVK